MKEDLWGIVNETEDTPAIDASAARVAKYRARRDRALATIVLSIEPSLLYLLVEPKNPVESWKKIEGQFQKKIWANKLVLRRKLHSLQLIKGNITAEENSFLLQTVQTIAFDICSIS